MTNEPQKPATPETKPAQATPQQTQGDSKPASEKSDAQQK
jgi:hypothetical protein